MRTLHLSNTRSSPLRPRPKLEPHPTASPPPTQPSGEDSAPQTTWPLTSSAPEPKLYPGCGSGQTPIPGGWSNMDFGHRGYARPIRQEQRRKRCDLQPWDGAGDRDSREQPTTPQDQEEHLPEAKSEARRSPYRLPSTQPSGHFCAASTARGLPYPGFSPKQEAWFWP